MKFRKNFSVVLLYNDYWEVFIQDRKSISKRGEEWWVFWWWVEEGESFDEALIREVKEELNIDITDNFTFIWKIINSLVWIWEQTSYLYLVKYDVDLHKDLKVLEWDWAKFVSLDEFSTLKIAPWTYLTIEMYKRYFWENWLEISLEFPKPSDKYKYEEAVNDWKKLEKKPTSPWRFFDGEDFEDFLRIINNDIDNNPNGVNSHQYFLKKWNDILWSLQVRHTIEHPNLKEFWWHIWYAIVPKHRKKWYATKMLKLWLEKAKELWLDKVLITCDTDNIWSSKVIEKNWWVFERFAREWTKKRYWINL